MIGPGQVRMEEVQILQTGIKIFCLCFFFARIRVFTNKLTIDILSGSQ